MGRLLSENHGHSGSDRPPNKHPLLSCQFRVRKKGPEVRGQAEQGGCFPDATEMGLDGCIGHFIALCSFLYRPLGVMRSSEVKSISMMCQISNPINSILSPALWQV